tara:strand:+ start:157 stop:741 length:585 start_codon:yes stop_codon:yes gene_type:complete
MNENYKFWKKIWDMKGNSDSHDLLYLDGYEHLSNKFNGKEISDNILKQIEASEDSSILEVACGAGFLAREMQSVKYTGVDYSRPIVQKHKNLFPEHDVLLSEANALPFKDNQFDYVFCFGLFQYLPNKEYADKTIAEMTRVARKKIFLGDLKNKKTRNEHFVYPLNTLINTGYTVTDCLYDKQDKTRYNAMKDV